MKYIGFKFWLIVLLALVVFSLNLGTIPLLDPDEPVYGQTAKEMISYGDYISPRIYGEYWYDKPPMYYWLVALSYKILGVSEFSSRFPSAFIAVLGIALVYVCTREIFSPRAGVISALTLFACIEYTYLAKAAVTDMTLCFFLTGALLSFLTKRYYFFYIFAALAVLTKGPVGILFPLAIIGIYLLMSGNLNILRRMKLVSGTLLFSAIALPWYAIMYDIHGQIFIETFLGFHNITRFTTPEHVSSAVWYFFIPVLIIGFFPWTAILPQAIWNSLVRSNYQHANSLLFLNIWAAFIFLFFTFSQTKLVSYILPMYPALAIIIGWYIDTRWNDNLRGYFSWGVLLFLTSFLLIGLMWYGVQQMPELLTAVIYLSVILIVMVLVCLFFIWKGQSGSIFWTQFASTLVFITIFVNMIFPVVAPMFSSKYIADEFLKKYDGQSPVNILKFLRPGFAYYTDIYGREIPPKTDLEEFMGQKGVGYYITRYKDYLELSDDAKRRLRIIAQMDNNIILLKY